MEKGCCGKLKKLFFHPKSFFSEVEKEKSYSPAMFFYVKLSLIAIILELVLTLAIMLIQQSATLIGIVNVIISSIINIGFAFVIPFVAAAIVYLGVLIFRGKQGFFNTYKPITYALAVGIIYNIIVIIVSAITAIVNSSYAESLATITSPEMLWQNTGFVISMIIYGIVMLISLIHMIYTATTGLSKFQKISKLKSFFSIIIIPLAIIIVIILLIILGYLNSNSLV